MLGESDLKLVWRFLQKNETAAFEQLVVRHRRWVLSVCRSFLRSEDLAEDATQEVFARCFEKLRTFEGPNLAGWLKVIAVNCCLNIIDKEKRWVALEDTVERGEGSVERQVIYAERLEQARRGIEALPEKQRIVFCMKYLDGCSYEEIQKLTGFSANEVKSYLQNARRNFENWWEAQKEKRP